MTGQLGRKPLLDRRTGKQRILVVEQDVVLQLLDMLPWSKRRRRGERVVLWLVDKIGSLGRGSRLVLEIGTDVDELLNRARSFCCRRGRRRRKEGDLRGLDSLIEGGGDLGGEVAVGWGGREHRWSVGRRPLRGRERSPPRQQIVTSPIHVATPESESRCWAKHGLSWAVMREACP